MDRIRGLGANLKSDSPYKMRPGFFGSVDALSAQIQAPADPKSQVIVKKPGLEPPKKQKHSELDAFAYANKDK